MKTRAAILFFFFILLALVAVAQPINKEQREAVLAAISKNISERAYVGGVDFSKWGELLEKFKDEFDAAETHDRFALAVNRAFREFGFSHLNLLTPRAAETRETGRSVGIGVLIEQLEDGIRITRVLPGGPASKAGLKEGDILKKADGEPIKGPEQVRGEKGTSVKLEILRTDGTIQEVTIVRDEFSVLIEDEIKWIDDQTALIRINSFATGYKTKKVDEMFEEAKKAKRIIIDLRSNGGGAVGNLAHLAGKVMKTGTGMGKFITRRDADAFKKENPDVPDEPGKVAEKFGIPISAIGPRDGEPFAGSVVVLTSGASASASEIFAATIKDQKRGKLVGTQTAGAVLASSFFRLPEGFSLQLPLMEYVTINKERLEHNGVKPDFEVPRAQVMDDDEVIKVALKAFESIQQETKVEKPEAA